MGKKEEKGEKENSSKDIVLKVYMHCEGCANEVFNCLKRFDGVEEVKVDSENNKVIVKGQKADPLKVLERIRRKYSRNVELISPKPKANDRMKKEPEKKQEPQIKTVVLKINMHCEGCAQDIKKNVLRMQGVLTVEPDMNKSEVIVRGVFDPSKLVKKIAKQQRKHVDMLKQEVAMEKQDKDNKKGTKEENMIYYPPQCSRDYIYPCQLLSDENVFSCSVM